MLATIQLALLLLCPVTNYLTLTQSQILPALPQAPEFKKNFKFREITTPALLPVPRLV